FRILRDDLEVERRRVLPDVQLRIVADELVAVQNVRRTVEVEIELIEEGLRAIGAGRAEQLQGAGTRNFFSFPARIGIAMCLPPLHLHDSVEADRMVRLEETRHIL